MLRILEGPLLLHPKKVSYLHEITRGITDGLTTHYHTLVENVKSELKLQEFAISIPPIADEILRTAHNERCSLLHAAVVVRESKEIASLRSLMWEFNAFAQGHQQIRYRHELQAKTKEIAHSNRTSRLFNLPKIEVFVRDKCLFVPPVVLQKLVAR